MHTAASSIQIRKRNVGTLHVWASALSHAILHVRPLVTVAVSITMLSLVLHSKQVRVVDVPGDVL